MQLILISNKILKELYSYSKQRFNVDCLFRVNLKGQNRRIINQTFLMHSWYITGNKCIN